MSFVKSMSVLSKLKPLLTGPNLAYLDQLLTQLTDDKSLSYNTIWAEFKTRYANPEQAQAAWNGLRTLLQVVRDQRKAGL